MKFYGGGAFYGNNPSEVAFYDGTNPTSSLVPRTYNAALNGRNYLLDFSQPFYRQAKRQLEPLIRTQADTSNEPGEQSMDPNGLWRRSFEDWRNGAGQRYLDRNTSQDNAYWVSKGVDTLTTAWQVSLLPAVNAVVGSVTANSFILPCNGYLYLIMPGSATVDAQVLPSAGSSWSPTITFSNGAAIGAACSDGHTVYLGCGASGIYTTTGGSGSSTNYVSASIGTSYLLGYVNGRLMLWTNVVNSQVYNIVAGGASLGTALITFDNPSSVVTCFTSGNSYLYMGVNTGGTGYVYGSQTTADGTTLAPPTVQTALPVGETVQSMLGYLNYLVVGTNLGVRLCQQGSTGITLGTLIPTPNPVACLAAYGGFVWFGFTNYDGVSTGLGKISLENFVVSGILPAYASDRMATAQGTVNSLLINPTGGCVAFTAQVGGLTTIYFDSTSLVPTGTVQSGYILYDLTDPKVPALIDVQGAAVQEFGTYQVSLAIDGNAFETVGSAGPGSLITNTYQLQQGAGSRFEVLLTLNRDSTTTTQGPVITRWTLRSYPAPLRPKTWQLPIVMNERLRNASGADTAFDPQVELNILEGLANSGQQVIYQEGNESYLVFVTDVQMIYREPTQDMHFFNGLCLVNIQSIPVPTPQYL